MSRIFLFALVWCTFAVNAHAGTERLVVSLCGNAGFQPISVTGAANLEIRDQWYDYMHLHPFDAMDPDRWDEVFRLKSARTRVVLRYDDARHYAPGDPWVIRITYDITTSDSSGTNQTRYDEVLEISYDPATSYTDIAINEYSDALKGSIVITAVEYWATGNTLLTPSSSIPAELSDVYLDLETETERYYYLDNTAPEVHRYSNTTDNTLWLGWDYIQGAESYDVEWLFIDAGTQSLSSDFAYDWKNATRVNVADNHYQVELAYPKGILLTRVRPVGVDYRNYIENGYVTRYDGEWSYTNETGTTNGDASDITSANARTDISSGRETALNWQYSASYAEDGKRKDVISFYDGSLYGRQTVTRSNTDSTLIVAETRYDSEGRAAVQIMPTPVIIDATQNIMRYQSDFNTGFTLADFDYDTKVNAPNRMDTTAVSGTTTGQYYSGTNTSTERGQQYQATTAGYAYTQVQYKNDGTNRPSVQGGVGNSHAIGSGHEVKYFYGTPTGQVELDRLFGNEVGYVQHYQKNLVVDPNGVVSVAYLDQEGRVIATALGGDAPDSLLPIDYTDYTPVPITADLLGNNDLNNDNEMVSHSTITVVGADVEYDFEYNLGIDTACGGDCFDTCATCRFDLEIFVSYENGDTVVPLSGSNPITATNIGSGSYTFTMELSTGVYHVTKVLKLNEENIEDLKAAFIAAQLDGEGCTDLVSTTPEPCALDCEQACEQLYIRDAGGGMTVYYDIDGNPTGSTEDENWLDLRSDAQELVADCQAQLCGAQAMPDPCALKYNNMVLDMSPGGQYFDNTPQKYVADALDSDDDGDNEELILNPSYDQNAWLEAHPDETAMLAAINAVWAGADFTTWDEVRADWDSVWGNILAEYHPEYCAWEYYCAQSCDTTVDGFLYVSNAATQHEYDQIFFYSTTGNYPGTSSATADEYELFNPTRIDENNDYTTNDVDQDHRTYQPYDKSNRFYMGKYIVDPKMQCDWQICEDTSARERLGMQLQRFLPLYDNSNVLIADAYHSIWYVIEDPEDIHLGTPLTTGLSQSIIDFYITLHGDGTNPGVLTTAGGDITPFQFFAGVYGYYRQLVIEQGFNYSATTNGESVYECQEEHFTTPYGHLQTAEPASPMSATGFVVYFPENAVLALHGNGCAAPVFGVPSGMDEYVTELDTEYGDEENTIETGYSGRAACSCGNLMTFISENDLEDELAGEEWDDIAAALNASLDYSPLGDGNYTDEEVEAWILECGEEEPDWDDLESGNFPSDLACPPDTVEVGATTVNELLQDECEAENGALADMNDSIIIYQNIYALAALWEHYYRTTCLQKLEDNETFTVEYELQEYHYTLYYYDQAGTLVKTVPPEGVRIIDLTADSESSPDTKTDGQEITEWRKHWRDHAYDGTALPMDVDYTPAVHGMVTNYQYNSLQQPVQSVSPDITRETKFFYDPLGRLIVSQDARQYDAGDLWSYVLYDALGRVYESGEIENTTAMTEEIARAQSGTTYTTWLGLASGRTQVVRTQYETSLTGVAAMFPNSEQKNTRNRVASITWEAVDDSDPDTWDNASHFSYDIHGNVDYLVQENHQLSEIGQDVKHIRYEYDLISGNVKAVHYQEGEFDEFHHGYLYDADNRVTTSYTWRGPLVHNAVETWEKEQKNFYYLTGPLLRQEIGDKTVQAMDYAYTAQGWIKVMNAGSISSTRDIGRDGYSENISGSTSTNMYTGMDAAGFVLNYFSSNNRNGDYWAPAIATAGASNSYLPTVASATTRADYCNLYNGNIASMVTSLTDENEDVVTNQIKGYRYDQLNRIKQVRAHENYSSLTNTFTGTTADAGLYAEDFTFDRNGNIITVDRNGNNSSGSGTQAMDEFTYYYYLQSGLMMSYSAGAPLNATNKLAYVDDNVSSGNYTTDIDNQSSGNYEYDGNGNLTKDPSEEIDKIEWYASGKIKKIEREASSTKSDLEFIYDASGNRIIKIVKPRDGTGVLSELHWSYTYYVRDASGNVMAVYERSFREDEGANDIFYDDFKNAELHIYGSKRVGTNNVDSLITYQFEDADFMDSYGDYFDDEDYDPVSPPSVCTTHCKTNYRRELGNKQYEVTNHLGNVLATVSDRRLPSDNYRYITWTTGTKYAYDAQRNMYYPSLAGTYERTGTPGSPTPDNIADYYTADVISYSDYYAFGAQMEGRSGGTYRYDFNGKETDVESDLQDYGMRIYNARLGKFLSVDPLTGSYPWYTPYQFAGNKPIRAIDLDGLEENDCVGVPATRDGLGLYTQPQSTTYLETPAMDARHAQDVGRWKTQKDQYYALVYVQTGFGRFSVTHRSYAPVTFNGGSHYAGVYSLSGSNDIYPIPSVYDHDHVESKWKYTHMYLDAVGMIPGIGDFIADPINSMFYSSEGDFTNASISAAAMIPVVGWGATGAKWTLKLESKLATNGVNLSTHYYNLQKYGKAGFRTLDNGRIRYYGMVTNATKPGMMMGRRTVKEWNPLTGNNRVWMETLDHGGNIRQVRPDFGGVKGPHYTFGANGNYTGKW